MKTIFFGIIISVFALSSSVWATEKVDKLVDSEKGGEVSIRIDRGIVEIIGWDKPKVKVSGEIDKDVKVFELEHRGNKTSLIISSEQNHSRGRNDTNIKVYIPNKTELEFEGAQLSVEVKDISGEIEIATVHGEIIAKKLSGDIELSTVNGSIEGDRLVGEIQYETINGSITDKNSSGDELEVKTVNGEVFIDTKINKVELEGTNVQSTIKMDELDKVEITTVNGDLRLEVKSVGDDASAEVQSVNGNIHLSIPTDKGVSANVQILKHGNIINKLSKHKAKPNNQWQGFDGGKHLKFEIGEGNTEIQVNSIEGDVTLKARK